MVSLIAVSTHGNIVEEIAEGLKVWRRPPETWRVTDSFSTYPCVVIAVGGSLVDASFDSSGPASVPRAPAVGRFPP